MVSVKDILREVTPPIVSTAARKAFPKKTTLFDGDAEIFLSSLSSAKVYGEYGCGTSTIYVANNTQIPVHSVDTSDQWVTHVKEAAKRSDVDVRYVDLGELGIWGRPCSYTHAERFKDYRECIWSRSTTPDLVLVDGRFRVACFATSVLRAATGTAIIFDDYVGRPHYHIVEEILKPVRVGNRQALFVVDRQKNETALQNMIDNFAYVME